MLNIDRLKSACKLSKRSMAYVCREIGVNGSYFVDYKKGKCSIGDDTVIKIANALNTTPAYLNGETDNPSPEVAPVKEIRISTEHMTDADVEKLLSFARFLSSQHDA